MKALRVAAAVIAALWVSSPAAAASYVSLPGGFESELGCAGDWDPYCAEVQMTKSGDGLWYAAFLVGVGDWEYKVAYDKTWTENYGASGQRDGANMTLALTDAATVYFRHDEATHLTVAQLTPFAEASAVPEPATWAMILLGFGAAGVALRRKPRHRVAAAG